MEYLALILASFVAGLIDSIVGGGGLIQLPALMMVLPHAPVVSLLGTNKMVSVTGTAFSAYRFSKKIPYLRSIIIPAIFSAFIFSFIGAYVVTLVGNNFLKPIFTVLLFFIFLLTLKNNKLGITDHQPDIKISAYKPILIGIVIGFYDGFFGPGTGSLLILAFVGLLQMTFVQGSAYAKMINLSTNIAAILFFIIKGHFLPQYLLPMMIANVAGASVGVKLALLKGNNFVRTLLRFVIFLTICKLTYDLIKAY